ncbi:MAG: hypothetical protein OXC41_07645 [Gammaproteobacteria bacterium]|nr:hypothetical protein [Gammaproteobacteria bacterium]
MCRVKRSKVIGKVIFKENPAFSGFRTPDDSCVRLLAHDGGGHVQEFGCLIQVKGSVPIIHFPVLSKFTARQPTG